MIVRTTNDVTPVLWGNGTSHRMLIAADSVGYTVTDTVVWAGTSSHLQYRNHVEACFCIAGKGTVETSDGRSFRIVPGTIYVLDEHEQHTLSADADQDLRLICTFSPALVGEETHRLDAPEFSAY